MASETSANDATDATAEGRDYRSALTLLASLFFMWGFITVINNTLLPHLRSVFDLDYTDTTLIESVWFIAYFVASIPSAKLIERIGYQRSLVTGLVVMAVGSSRHDAGGQSAVVRRDAGRCCSSSPAASRCCRSRPIPTWRWSAGRRPPRRDSTWCRR